MVINIYKNYAFTLLEMMVAVSIVAILAGYGIPNLYNMIQSTKIVSYANSMVGGIALAEQAAQQYSKTAVFCPSTNRTSCSGLANDYLIGWLIYIDENNDGSLGSGERIVETEIADFSNGIRINENLGSSSYNIKYYAQQDNYLISGNDLTLTFCKSGIFPTIFNYSAIKKRASVKTDRNARCS